MPTAIPTQSKAIYNYTREFNNDISSPNQKEELSFIHTKPHIYINATHLRMPKPKPTRYLITSRILSFFFPFPTSLSFFLATYKSPPARPPIRFLPLRGMIQSTFPSFPTPLIRLFTHSFREANTD